jgi:hypothetical protein
VLNKIIREVGLDLQYRDEGINVNGLNGSHL